MYDEASFGTFRGRGGDDKHEVAKTLTAVRVLEMGSNAPVFYPV